MKVRIEPGAARGTVSAPPSKSMSHRLLVCAGLSGGPCRVDGIVPSEDVLATVDCLRALGAECVLSEGAAAVKRRAPIESGDPVSCRESGSTLRFFIPLFLLRDTPVTLTGAPRLLERPMAPFEDLCARQGLTFRREGPLLRLQGPLRPGRFSLPGNVSSQFVSGLLFALPLLAGDSEIALTSPASSRGYIGMTRQAQAAFGVRSEWTDETTLRVSGGQTYRPADTAVEGDWSNAAFLEGLNLLGGSVTVTGLDENSLQGDRVFRGAFAALRRGCPTLDIDQCPDLGPVLMALAAANHGAVLTGTARLRHKESDRGAAMAEELLKLGVRCTVEENAIRVGGGTLRPADTPLFGHNDHRVVMALSLLLTVVGGTLDGAEAAAKSWPDYFAALRRLGIKVETR